jgi:hypothetical protein
LHLRVQRILRHDDNHGHVLVDQRKRAVLELASKDTYDGGVSSRKVIVELDKYPRSACS